MTVKRLREDPAKVLMFFFKFFRDVKREFLLSAVVYLLEYFDPEGFGHQRRCKFDFARLRRDVWSRIESGEAIF